MKKLLGNILKALLYLSIFTILVGGTYLLFFPFKVAEFKNIYLVNTVSAGGSIQYKVDFCRYVGKVRVDVNRYLEAKDPALTNPIQLSGSPNLETLDGQTGCRTSAQPIKLPVEVSTPAGEYRLRIQATYYIPPFNRPITVEGFSPYFQISQPSIPNQLSVISQQLSQIEGYVQAHPGSGDVGNISAPDTTQAPTVPNTVQATPQSTVNPQPATTQSMTQSLLMLKSGIIDLQLSAPVLK